jgi:hypothetical protein
LVSVHYIPKKKFLFSLTSSAQNAMETVEKAKMAADLTAEVDRYTLQIYVTTNLPLPLNAIVVEYADLRFGCLVRQVTSPMLLLDLNHACQYAENLWSVYLKTPKIALNIPWDPNDPDLDDKFTPIKKWSVADRVEAMHFQWIVIPSNYGSDIKNAEEETERQYNQLSDVVDYILLAPSTQLPIAREPTNQIRAVFMPITAIMFGQSKQRLADIVWSIQKLSRHVELIWISITPMAMGGLVGWDNTPAQNQAVMLKLFDLIAADQASGSHIVIDIEPHTQFLPTNVNAKNPTLVCTNATRNCQLLMRFLCMNSEMSV